MATAPTLYWYQLNVGTYAPLYYKQLDDTVKTLCSENNITAPNAKWYNSITGTFVSTWMFQIDTTVRQLCSILSVSPPIEPVYNLTFGQSEPIYAADLDMCIRLLCGGGTNPLHVLTLSNYSIESEDAENSSVGTIQNGTAGSTFSMTDTAGGRFKIVSNVVKVGAVAPVFADGSYNITIRETNIELNATRDTTLTINVTPNFGTPDFWVDSTLGNNANPGTQALPFQTWSAVPLANRVNVRIVPGSLLREMVDTGSHTDITIVGAKDPGDTLATITAFNIVNPASWVLASGQTLTYQTTVAHSITENSTAEALVLEDNIIMARQSSIAAVEATAGSFYCPTDLTLPSHNPYTIYYHPTGNGNPASNGKIVEAVARPHDIENVSGSSLIVQGIQGRGMSSNDGCIDGGDLTLKQSYLTYGGKHHIVFSSGLVEDCVMGSYDPTWVNSPPAITAYFQSDPVALSAVVRRCFGIVDAVRGYLSHFGTGNYYLRQDIEQCILHDMSPSGLNSYVTNCFSNGGSKGVSINLPGTTINVSRSVIKDYTGQGISAGIVSGNPAANVNVSQSAFLSNVAPVGSRFAISTGTNSPLVASNMCIVCSTTGAGGFAIGASNAVTLNNSIIVLESGFQFVQAGGSYSGNNNVYVKLSPSGNYHFKLGATTYTNNFSAWQAATGADANSAFFSGVTLADVFLGDPYSGDLRINTGTAVGAAIAARSAGVTEYWDWNARAVQSGPLTLLPVGPESAADALDYLADPVTWDFYP